jgi:hypothetical protein
MLARLAAVLLVVVCVPPAFAGGGRKQTALCKKSCGATIDKCVADLTRPRKKGPRLRKCKRQVIGRCKREGVAICTVSDPLEPTDPGETYTVTTTGADDSGCGAPATPCRTIQFVVDQRVPYGGAGTIKVAAGTFDGVADCPVGPTNQAVVCIVNRQVTLRGGFVPPNWETSTNDPSATVIDAKGAGRGVHIVRGGEVGPTASLVMDGFTIQNGLVEGATSGSLGELSSFGGGMYAEHSSITLRNVVFRNNEARGGTTTQVEGGRASGGALAVYSGWASVPAPATLRNVTFENNRTQGGRGADMGGYALGGAMFTSAIVVDGDGIVFRDNAASGGPTSGAGTNGAEKADALGGALAVETGGTVELRNVQASGNVATGGAAPNGDAGGSFGGAMYAEQATLTLVDARIVDNRTRGGDGENVTTGGSIAQGGGVQALMSNLTLDRVVVMSNESRAGDGARNGGVAVGGGVAVILGAFQGTVRPFTLRNVVIADNQIVRGAGAPAIGGGGGLYVNGAAGTLAHATIADNRLGDPNDVGGGIAAQPVPGFDTHVNLVDSIVANHRTASPHPSNAGTAGVWIALDASADLTRVLFANNLHDSNAGQNNPFNLPPGAFTMTAVSSAASAGFVAPGDYHLAAGSPAIDQAVGSSLGVDVEGTSRPKGAAADLGAYERQP